MEILVLGSNGVLGRNFVDLLERDHIVSKLDIADDNCPKMLTTINSRFKRLSEKADVIIMLNGLSRLTDCEGDIPFAVQKNVSENVTYFDILRQINFGGRIILASSIYADFEEKTVYGLTKYSVEKFAKLYVNKFGLKIDVIRLGSIYGDGFDTNSLPIHLLKSNTTRTFQKNISREYIFVNDTINTIMKIVSGEYNPTIKRLRGYEVHDLPQLINSVPEKCKSQAESSIAWTDLSYPEILQYAECHGRIQGVLDIFVEPTYSLKDNLKKISKQAIFFDFDGTIFDSADAKIQAFFELYQSYDALNEASEEYLIENVGLPRQKKLEHLMKIKEKNININSLHTEFEAILCDKLKKADLVLGAKEYLQKLKHLNIPAYLISAAPTSEVKYYLRSFSIDDYFEDLICDCDNKVVQLADLIKANNIDATYSKYYGDSLADYEASVANRVQYINIGSKIAGKSIENFKELLQ